MAKVETVTLIDDLDGKSTADETVKFGYAGREFEIDLTAANANKLRELLAPFADKARAVRGGKRAAGATTPARVAAADRDETRAIREWAQDQGMAVSDRGRIPANVREAYANRNRVASSPAAKAPHDRPSASVTPIRPAAPAPVAEPVEEAPKKAPAKSAGKTKAGLPKVEPKPVGVKVNKMTAMQTAAVEDMGISTHEVAKTFVVFAASTPTEVLGMIRAAMQKYDGDKTTGTYPSMKAVVRKLEAADPKTVQVVEVEAA